jgi:hypothetical protein
MPASASAVWIAKPRAASVAPLMNLIDVPNENLIADKQWTLAEIAEREQVDYRTVRRWTKRRVNRLRVIKHGHRTVRVPDSFYAAFLNSRMV